MTDPMGLMGGGGNHAPQSPLPAVDDPCVSKFINDNYGNTLGFIAEISNLQQFFPSANPNYLNSAKEGLNIANEKLIATKGPGAVGNALMSRFPGNLGIGHVVGSGLAGFGGLASGVVEVAGAFMTPFGTTAMAQARTACSCRR